MSSVLPRCRATRLRPISWLPRISMGLTLTQLSARLRCAECGGPLHSVELWRLDTYWASRWDAEGWRNIGERQAFSQSPMQAQQE